MANPAEDRKPAIDLDKTRKKAQEALSFCKAKNYNTDYCVLIDMSLHSGVKRFFVWDFKRDTLDRQFLVAHGCCNQPWSQDASRKKPAFSNQHGSHCSSLGKYRIGERSYSQWGIHIKYRMHGLEATNNNALARNVVLHSWEEVSDDEVYPAGTAEGWGCPVLSNTSMRILDAKLKSSTRPVLLWIYV